jgi:phosphoribosyl 1,2-cyclic phosphate phosphodiesterase
LKTGKVVLLGTGTSQGVPIIGCSCRVCRSCDYRDKRLRTSALISTIERAILVDPGPDFRQQALRHSITNLDGVLITHEHKDHTGGIDDLRPLSYLHNKDIQIFGWERVMNRIRLDYAYAFTFPKYPGVPEIELNAITTSAREIAGFPLIFFEVMHHQLPVLALRCGDFAYVTDANYLDDNAYNALDGVSTLVLDALQPQPHLSHFTLDEAIDVAKKIKADRTIFTHISHRMGVFVEINNKLPSKMEYGYDGLSFNFNF